MTTKLPLLWVSYNITGTSSTRGIQLDLTVAVGLRFIQSVVICKHGLEEVGQFVVHEFTPQLRALHIKYVFDFQHVEIFKRRIRMSIIRAVRHNSQGTFLQSEYFSHAKKKTKNKKTKQNNKNHVIPNCKWESTSYSYINFIADRRRYLLSQFLMPNVREIVFAIFDEWYLQFTN